ncbi:hypothetical protein, partial, partial [Absidia glauca]
LVKSRQEAPVERKEQGGQQDLDNKKTSSPSSNGWHQEFAMDSGRWQQETDHLEDLHLANEKVTGLPIYKGYIGKESMQVIIDSGASANYVSRRLAKGLPQYKLKNPLPVNTAAKKTTMVDTVVQVPISFDGKDDETVIEALVFPSRFDLILGLEWLEQVNPKVDWKTKQWTVETKKGALVITPEDRKEAEDLNFVVSPKQV